MYYGNNWKTANTYLLKVLFDLIGLALNNDNIKAYYRKASALKISREYKFALVAAEEGQRRADRKDRKSDVSCTN